MKKLFFLTALLCASLMANAYTTAPDTWIGGGGENDKFKWYEITDGTHPSDVVNIQQPGFASKKGIYVTFVDAAFDAVYYNNELKEAGTDYAQQGAGLCFYISSLTEKNTDILLKQNGTTKYGLRIYNDNGTDPDTRDNPNLTITSSTLLTLDPEGTSTITYTTLSEGAVSFTSSDINVATVNTSTGEITAVAAGTATITVAQEGTKTYKPASKKVSVTVNYPKKASNHGYGSLRLIDADLYDWNGNYFAGQNACGKVDLFVVTYGDKLIYKAVAKNGKTIENDQNYFCQLRTWNPDSTGVIEHWALTRSQDLTTAYLMPNQATNANGLSTYGNEILLTTYMVVSGGCGARTIQTVPYTRDYIHNYDSSDETAPVLGAATVTPGEDDITISFDEVTSEDVFYMIVDAAHNKKYCSLKPEFVLAKDGSGITYNYSCYAIDFSGNMSSAVLVEVNMDFSAIANQALNRYCEAGYEDGNAGEAATKANDGDESTAWVTYADRPAAEEWWYVDLNEVYDLDNIEIVWGDVYSTKYILQTRKNAPSVADLSDDDAWTTMETVTDVTASSTKTTDVSSKVGRYIRFRSLTRSAGFIRMKEFRVYATGIHDASGDDDEAPVISSASVTSHTHNSAVIEVTASDNVGIVKIHATDASKGYSEYFNIDPAAASLSAEGITITGLTDNTTYNITLVAYDANDNTSSPLVVEAFKTDLDTSIPLVAAPVPSGTGKEVRPIYSDAFASILAHPFDKDGFAGVVLMMEKDIDGDNCLVYNINGSNEVTWGMYDNGSSAIIAQEEYRADGKMGIDASAMEKLHIDIWSLQAINNAINININDAALTSLRLSHSGEGWQSYDIDLSEFAEGEEGKKIDNVRWMKFNGIGPITGKMALDNVYFWKDNGSGTAISNAEAEVKAVKMIENGQLVIIKNGVKYNVAGQQVK